MANKKQKLTLEKQIQLLDISINTGEAFNIVLSRNGFTYDDLCYEKSELNKNIEFNCKSLNEFAIPKHNTPVVSFFSGCGGLDLGFEAAGFDHIACFEHNELFCKTLRRNRPKWNVFGPPVHPGDVSNFNEIFSVLNQIIEAPFPGIFIGGPPCQPFSIASNQRFSKFDDNFKRVGFSHEKNGNLLFDYIKLIIKFRPQVFLIENVAGLRDLDDGKQLSEAISMLQNSNYEIEPPFVLNAANFGVPQQRERLFIIGNLVKKSFNHLMPSTDTIGCSSVLLNGDSFKGLANTETRVHSANSIKRYYQLEYGQRDQMGRVDRLNPLLPSKTVIAGGTKGGGRSHLHPEIPRTLSVRECARLQTFPDDFIFLGPTARQFTQVGNAVPPVLAAQIGIEIFNSFFKE